MVDPKKETPLRGRERQEGESFYGVGALREEECVHSDAEENPRARFQTLFVTV